MHRPEGGSGRFHALSGQRDPPIARPIGHRTLAGRAGCLQTARSRICAVACYVQWSADGKYMYVSLTSRVAEAGEPTRGTYAIRIHTASGSWICRHPGSIAPARPNLPGSKRFPTAICRPGLIPKHTPSRRPTSRGIYSGSRCIEAISVSLRPLSLYKAQRPQAIPFGNFFIIMVGLCAHRRVCDVGSK